MSIFGPIDLLPDDPIFNLPILYGADTRSQKVNLGVGAYRDAMGKPVVFRSVRKAEQMLLEKKLNKEYSPIEGNCEFFNSLLPFVFASSVKDYKTIFAMQTVGGTSALKIGADFLHRQGISTISLPDPGWPNHEVIFQLSDLKINFYPYCNKNTFEIDFSVLCQNIASMPKKSAILLQASCHNPTGIDPSQEQWRELSFLIKKNGLIPFFDLAYQGLGNGLDEDAFPVRLFAEEGHQMLMAYSCSKNFGLYGERVGMLAAVTDTPESAKKIGSHLKQIVRGSYSTSPLHGSRIVATILQSAELTAEWKQELDELLNRIQEMRQALATGLQKSHLRDYSFLRKQLGIFSYIGLTTEQTQYLQKEKGIYMPSNGRINIAGLNLQNLDYVIDALIQLLKP